jgi:FkbM family methyltransferase
MDWTALEGSQEMLRLMRRDAAGLASTIALVPGRTAAVQAGGNLGVYPKVLAESFRTVYVAEPSHMLFARLMANAPEPNIVKLQVAFGDTREMVGMSQTRRDKPGLAHEGVTHIAGPGVIPTITIDDLGLAVCDLICLDVEGYELKALRGAVETVRRCRPVVSVEINTAIQHYGSTGDDVRGYLRLLGYRHAQTVRDDEVWVP